MSGARHYDVVVVGGGILGSAVAWELARAGMPDVLVIDAEAAFDAHSTGRSAAYYIPMYESKAYAALSKASIGFLTDPPDGFSDRPIFSRDGAVIAAGLGKGQSVIDEIATARDLGLEVESLPPSAIRDLVPAVRAEKIEAAAWYASAGEIDVPALAEAYRAGAKRAGVTFLPSTRYLGVATETGRVTGVETSAGTFPCGSVVNAAGAWAASVAEIAGGSSLEILVLRRHLLRTKVEQTGRWPFFRCPSLPLYFKLTGQELSFSPMDAGSDSPRDCPTDPATVTSAIETLNAYTTFAVRPENVTHVAGHRVFGADHAPLIGEDPILQGLYWAGGMGGCGIMAAPAVGRMIAADILDLGRPIPTEPYEIARFGDYAGRGAS